MDASSDIALPPDEAEAVTAVEISMDDDKTITTLLPDIWVVEGPIVESDTATGRDCVAPDVPADAVIVLAAAVDDEIETCPEVKGPVSAGEVTKTLLPEVCVVKTPIDETDAAAGIGCAV